MATKIKRSILIKKTQFKIHKNLAEQITKYLTGLYVSDEDANKIIGLIDTLKTRYNISAFSELYPKYAKGSNLEADIKKYLDSDEVAELFKRIKKKAIV